MDTHILTPEEIEYVDNAIAKTNAVSLLSEIEKEIKDHITMYDLHLRIFITAVLSNNQTLLEKYRQHGTTFLEEYSNRVIKDKINFSKIIADNTTTLSKDPT